MDLEDWLPRRGLITKASGVQNFSDQTGVFGPKVGRVFLSEPVVSSSDFSGPESFVGVGPVLLARRKNVCVSLLKMVNFSHL